MDKDKTIGQVIGIYIQDKETRSNMLIEEGYFQEDKGLVGDIGSHKEHRQVSFFTSEGWGEILSSSSNGLCIKKFHENIRIRNLKLNDIKTGSLIKVGRAIFQITEIGKRCFPECAMVKEGITCPLSTQVMFAKVTKSGSVKVGDSLFIVNSNI